MVETYYVLKNENLYVANQDFPGPTTEDATYAIKFRSIEKAKNYRKHCMQAKENDWEVIPFTVETNVEGQKDKQIMPNSDTLKAIIATQVTNSEAKSLSDSIHVFATQMLQLIDSKEAVENYQSRCDHRLIDVYHYVEFNELSEDQSKEIVKLIQTILKQRRMIKDAIQVISIIERSGIIEDLYEMTSLLTKMDSRVYTPRVLNELFEDIKEDKD